MCVCVCVCVTSVPCLSAYLSVLIVYLRNSCGSDHVCMYMSE